MRFEKYIPKVTRRALLFVSGLAWFLTSCFLIVNSISGIFNDNYQLMIRLAICIPVGLLLYHFIFRKIVIIRYLDRIINMDDDNPHLLSFMGSKGYVFFFVMASISFCLELYKLVTLDYLFTFQSIMSVPVLLTSVYFFREWHSFYSN